MGRPPPTTCNTRNGPADNEALKRRGARTIWLDPEMAPGCPADRQTCLTMKVPIGMALRQTTGFVESLLRLTGLDWTVPDFSTLSRRQKTLAVNIPYRGSKGPLHLLIDSTGIKVEGEGEWHARKHGGPKRRVWRKIHIGIDEKTLEVRAAEFTTSDVGDAPMLPELLDRFRVRRAILIGHSDGASIALIHAGGAAARARIAGVVCLAPHVFNEELCVASIREAKIAYETTDLPARLGRHHADPEHTFRGWNDIWLHPDFWHWNIEEFLPSIGVPVMVVQGEDDEYGTIAQVEAIEAQVPGPVERVLLPACRHSPHRDQPAATALSHQPPSLP